ncbi:MAG: PilN domain-containing protein [Ruminobacter sp.]|uniref:Type IV pilus assembly protein PilN n=1 Tax=Ruminobacter amylophilus TaxID=867 RepID=A0A662ZIT4_9GAMM|nr:MULTISPECIES: PilN domain-containing protein [Ruminobacter]MBQ3775741.1 PilN domain-containing protein [Ruminobacter sp.]SFP58246.1 type IV pilus assembly protein PilN [Ruminobacter amylophilus]
MSNINLLPWREVIKERQRKNFLQLMVVFLFAGAIVAILIYFALDWRIQNQEDRNSQWKNEIKVVDQKIAEIEKLKQRRQELIDRMNAIDKLQQSRNIPVHLYSDLPTLVSSGVYLGYMNYDNRIVKLGGLAESNPRLSSMLRNIDNSQWLGNGTITQTKAEVRDGKKIIPTLPDGLYAFDMLFSVLDSQNNAQAPNNSMKGGR